MEKKEYYTFAEIIMALRKHYRMAFNILHQMKNCFIIDPTIYNGKLSDKTIFTSDYDLYFKRGIEDEAHFVIRIKKSPSNHLDSTRQFITDNHVLKLFPYTEQKLYYMDHAKYWGAINKNIYYYILSSDHGNNTYFKDKLFVSIDYKEEYDELFHRLNELEICNVLNELIYINNFQNLKLDASGVKLQFGNDYFNMKYNARNDNISYKTNNNIDSKYCIDYVEDILYTKIPRYEIPESYLKILDNTPLILNDIHIIDPIGKKGTLSISGDEKELVLTKSLTHDKIKI